MIFRPDLVNLDDFNYELPKEKIALFPLENRDSSKLLVADCKSLSIKDDSFFNLPDYLPNDSLLIVNSTKVIAARLLMLKPTGGGVELLCISPLEPSNDPQITVSAKKSCKWECIVGGRNVKEGMVLVPDTIYDCFEDFRARIISRFNNQAVVEFTYPADKSFSEVLLEFGAMPLPPYINREAVESDSERYQTVYSNAQGSVAAPTAGLHFTDNILKKLKDKGISKAELVLHVGPGTFKPIDVNVSSHDMHKEQFFVSKEIIEMIISNCFKKNKLIATGTTSLRTLESLYWIGMKAYYENYNIADSAVILDQFEPYKLSEKYKLLTVEQSFSTLRDRMEKSQLATISGETKLFIIPGYEVQTADLLITNFHLPKSTLLLLVSAFVGEAMREKIYTHALSKDYRFLSYGDSSLLYRELTH